MKHIIVEEVPIEKHPMWPKMFVVHDPQCRFGAHSSMELRRRKLVEYRKKTMMGVKTFYRSSIVEV